MNTIQLACAATQNKDTKHNFGGIFSANTIKMPSKFPSFVIVNTDNAGEKGSHWVLF